MGIRIHRILGFGLTDVKSKGTRIADPRFDMESAALRHEYEDQFSRKNFIKFLKSEQKQLSEHNRLFLNLALDQIGKNKRFDPLRCLVHDGEYGLRRVFVSVIPSSFDSHYRYDDMLDYYMDERKSGPCNHVKLLHGNIYPYCAYIDSRTGEQVPDELAFPFIRLVNDVDKKDRRYSDAAGEMCDLFRKRLDENFDPFHHLAPEKPIDLICLLKFCKVFVEDATIWSLRPMVYTYWG